MANTKDHTKGREYRSWFNTDNPNHLLFTYRELSFEILGGVNTESYVMLRAMLIVKGNNKVERDHIDLYNNYQCTAFIKSISEKIGFSFDYVEQAFKKLTNALEEYKHQCIEKQKQPFDDKVLVKGEDRTKAKSVLTSPKILKRLSSLITSAGVVGNEEQALMLFVSYISRFQPYPLHTIVESNYHYLQTKVGALVPDEHKLTIDYLSDNALFYFDEDELAHKLILVEDTGSNKTKLTPLLSLQSKGRLTKTITQKDAIGTLRAVQRSVNGPICLSISTHQSNHFNNNTTLSFVINEEKGTVQDERMMTYQRKRSAGVITDHEEEKAKQHLWNIQRMLTPVKVINPHAEYLTLPESLQHKQLSNIQYLRFIELITFIKQYQKETFSDKHTGEVYIQTDTNDIAQAHTLLENVLIQKCDDLNSNTRQYFETLKTYLENNKTASEPHTFTNRELHHHTGIPISTIKRYHQTLVSKKYIEATGEGNRAVGYSYRIKQARSTEDIKQHITTTLTTSLRVIKNREGSPKPTVAQSENGLPKTNNHVGLG